MNREQRVTASISRKATAVGCWLVAPFNLAFAAVGAIPGVDYVLENKGLWLVCMAALLGAALWANRREGPRGAHWTLLLPVLAAAVLKLFLPARDMGTWQRGLSLVVLILGGVLFARARTGRKIKAAAGVLSVLMLLPAILMLLAGAMFGNDGITVRRFDDPDGYYEAEVWIADAGALGGETAISVYAPVPLPFGTLRLIRGEANLDWTDPDDLEVEWAGGNTITINGERIELTDPTERE